MQSVELNTTSIERVIDYASVLGFGILDETDANGGVTYFELMHYDDEDLNSNHYVYWGILEVPWN